MIKVILFDVDGVLISGKRFSEKFSKDYKIDKVSLVKFFEGPFQESLIGNADLKELLVPNLKTWGWEKTVDEFLKYWFEEEIEIDTELISYIKDLRKKGFVVCLATNQEKYRFKYFLEELGFADFFDKTFASAHLGHIKEDVRFFEKLMQDLKKFKKEEILFWDDSIINIDTAREFGINAEVYIDFSDFKRKISKYDLE